MAYLINPPGVISCPGSGDIADKILAHIEHIYIYESNKKSEIISSNYGLPINDVLTRENLLTDVFKQTPNLDPIINERRSVNFKVNAIFTRFANGEIKTEITDSIRDRDIYIVQDCYSMADKIDYYGSNSPSYNVNDHLITLFTTIDACRVAGAGRITCVLPAYPYARQHKRKGRECITATLIGRLLEDMGVNAILTLDIHSRDIENTFKKLHLDNLHASYPIIKQLNKLIDIEKEDLVVVAPDTGAIDRNKYYANSIKKPLALLYKERDYSIVSTSADSSNIVNVKLLGDVKDKTIFVADDMLGTGGTLIKALSIMKEMGAKDVIIGISLPLFTGNAFDKLNEAYEKGLFKYLIGCNAVNLPKKYLDAKWFYQADVTKLFAKAIIKLHNNQSLGPLLDNNTIIQSLLNKTSDENEGF